MNQEQPEDASAMNDTAHQAEPAQYPPIAEVTRQLKIRWYRCPLDKNRLRELAERTDRQGWMQAGGHVMLYLVLAAISVAFWQAQNWWAFAVSIWCLGFVASFFKGTAAHELGHGTVFKTRSLNRIFLHTVCLISWWDPYDYATSHTYHHRYTTHREADRENLLPIEPSLHPWLMLQLFTVNLFPKPGRNFGKGGFFWNVYLTARSALAIPYSHLNIPSQEWLKVLHEDQPEVFRQSVIWSRVLLAFHGGVFLLALLSGWWVLPLVITLPSFIANIGSYLLGTTQHCGLQENVDDFRKNTRSIRLNPLLAFLYWHMNFHIEHHMYAGVPCYNLKALAKEIEEDMPVPHTLIGAWKEMRRIWRAQGKNASYRFEVQLPETKSTATAENDSELASSIGDLAPEQMQNRQH